MDRFKFRAPSKSSSRDEENDRSVEKMKKVEIEDDLWMDDIDEQTLLQASQLVESVQVN